MTCKTSKPKNRFPVYITGEPLNLTLYRERCCGDVRFALTYYDPTGVSQRRTFGTLDEANAEAAKLKDEIRQGGCLQRRSMVGRVRCPLSNGSSLPQV